MNNRRAGLTLLLTVMLWPLAAQDTRVILLGTGTPNPDPERMGPAVAVVSAGRVYLVDCGTGVVRRAVQAGLKAQELSLVFLTHLHSDHTLGLPDLLLTPGVMERPVPLEVHGPPGTKAMGRRIRQAWHEDLACRLSGLEPGSPAGYALRVHEIKPGEVYRDRNLRVTAFPVRHGEWKHAFGYRFEAPDKTIVISGDTVPCESLAQAAAGCDILVHEVYCRKGWEKRTPDWQRYHAASHTSAPDLGRLAARLRPKKLVLYHQLRMGETMEALVAEIREFFDGEIINGRDLDVIR